MTDHDPAGRISGQAWTPRTRALDAGRDAWNREQQTAAADRDQAILDYLADHPDASYADVARDVLNGVSRQRAEQLVRRARQRQETDPT